MSKGEIIPESAVRFVRAFDAPAGRVWQFLTDSALLPEWYGDGAIEPREGGAVTLMAGHIRGVVTGWRPDEWATEATETCSRPEATSRKAVEK